MNGHPRDQAKVSVHCRWPLVTGMVGKRGTPNIIHLAILPTTITTSDNLKVMQHNNWGSVGLQYANVCIQCMPRWFPCLLRYHTCHLLFVALVRQKALYMMCSAQTAQQLYSLVQTKTRYVLQHRGLNKQNTRLFRWCETNITKEWVGLPQSRGSSVLMTWHIARWSPDDSTEIWANCRSQVWVRDFCLKWPPKTWHLFALSVIEGADNQ